MPADASQHYARLDNTAQTALQNAYLIYEPQDGGHTRTLIVCVSPISVDALGRKREEAKEKGPKEVRDARSIDAQLQKWFPGKPFFVEEGDERIALHRDNGIVFCKVLEVPREHQTKFEEARKEHAMFADDKVIRSSGNLDTIEKLQEAFTAKQEQKQR